MNYIKITSTYSPVTTFYDSEMPYFPEIKDTFLWLYYSSENSTLDLCWWAESTDITTLRNTITSTKKKKRKEKRKFVWFSEGFQGKGCYFFLIKMENNKHKVSAFFLYFICPPPQVVGIPQAFLFFPKKDKYLYGSIGQFIWYTNWDWWRVRCTPN